MIKGKLHQTTRYEGGREVIKRVVAICDADLLGKVFEEGELVLDLQKYRSFYDGETLNEKKIAGILDGATSVNLVGKKTIDIAGKYYKIEPNAVKKIKGVPHLQIYYV
jgi:hypothetical protein